MARTPHEPRTYKTANERRLDALAALDDPTRPTLTLSQAALCVGVSVSTACKLTRLPDGTRRDTFELLPGVCVKRVAGTRRYVVAKAAVRAVLAGTAQNDAHDTFSDALASL